MSTEVRQLRRHMKALPSGWWGTLLLAGTEATIFGSLIATYFYLRVNATEWPMGGIEDPEPLLPAILTAALVLTSVPMFLAASAAIRGRPRAAWALALLALAVQTAYLAIQILLFTKDLDKFEPSDNAYGSIYYTLLAVHHGHVLVGIALTLWVVGVVAIRGLSAYRVTTVRNVAMYWHFVNAMAILVVLTQLSPTF
jgi:heme/copper-type cytochrome/quinol oxidase subunit 3